MKQPLMVAPLRIPPAQSEALYDSYLGESERPSLLDSGPWPGEDWDDDSLSAYRPMAPSETGKGRAAQH